MASGYNASDVHVDALLSNISVAYFQDDTRYVADKVFPIVPVPKASDSYWVFDKSDLFRDDAQMRAELAPAAEVNAKLGKDHYQTNTYAAKRLISDEVMANYDQPLDPIRAAVRTVTQKLRTRMETQFANDFFGTGKWTNDRAGVASAPTGGQFLQWTAANSNPLDDIEAAKNLIEQTGLSANTLVVGRLVWSVLRRHPDVIDLIKYNGAVGQGTNSMLTEQAMAQILDIDRVLVARSAYNSAVEGAADNFVDVIGKSALLVHTTPTPAIETATAGYIFQWTGISDGIGATIGTRQYRVEERRALAIESEVAFANKIVAPDLGVFMGTVIA